MLGGKAYKIRPVSEIDGWVADLCGYSPERCRQTVVLSQMFGMYRYMGWISGLKKNHSKALRQTYHERERLQVMNGR
jgi:hypothetical protein